MTSDILDEIKKELGEENTKDDIVSDYISKIEELEIDDELKGLINEARELVSIIDEFKFVAVGYSYVEFSINYRYITDTLTLIKERIRKLKQEQINIYM